MTITYTLGDKLYLNITNRCNCACVFCVRDTGDGVGDGENLWLGREPEAAEVIEDLKKRDLSKYPEVVFCGFGEPTENLETLLAVGHWLKESAPSTQVRLNTNGLCDLSAGKPVAPLLAGIIDIVSISLNAPNAARYQQITGSAYGERSFAAMLGFAEECKKHIPRVMFSVVDILTDEETGQCEKLASGMGIPLRVRKKI